MKKIKIVVGVTNYSKQPIASVMDFLKTEGIECEINISKIETIDTLACEITCINTKYTKQSLYDIHERYNPDVCCGTINIPNIFYIPNGEPFYKFIKLQDKAFDNYYKRPTMEEVEYCKEEVEYCKNDVENIKDIYAKNFEFNIKKVIFNDPATIVLWNDGTKTVVKAQEDNDFNEMVGLAMAISKKALGNKGNYYEVFKKWVPGPEESLFDWGTSISEMIARFKEYNEQMRKVQSVASATKEAMEKSTAKEPLKVGSYASQYKFDRITRSNKLVKNLYDGCCPNCGQNVSDTYEYCQNCGQKLDWTKWKDKEDE